jgi:predicted ATPase
MKRYILTGAPGAGKTTILRQLEMDGYGVVEEAATDVIALEQARGNGEPWTEPSFVDTIAVLQRERQVQTSTLTRDVQFYDRSPICTYALSMFLGHPVSATLSRELERIEAERIYDKQAFFIQNLGFVTPTEARRISFEDSLRFERVHEEAYRVFGYTCVPIAPGELSDRVEAIKQLAR